MKWLRDTWPAVIFVGLLCWFLAAELHLAMKDGMYAGYSSDSYDSGGQTQ